MKKILKIFRNCFQNRQRGSQSDKICCFVSQFKFDKNRNVNRVNRDFYPLEFAEFDPSTEKVSDAGLAADGGDQHRESCPHDSQGVLFRLFQVTVVQFAVISQLT